MQTVVGIDEVGIDKLIIEITDYAEKINKNYNLLEEIMEKTATCLKGQNGAEIRNYFNSKKTNFKTIKTNILSYKEDLNFVKRSYQLQMQKAAAELSKKSNH